MFSPKNFKIRPAAVFCRQLHIAPCFRLVRVNTQKTVKRTPSTPAS